MQLITMILFCEQIPKIDSSSDAGKKPDKVMGNVEFRNIHFRYPSRPDVKVKSRFQDTPVSHKLRVFQNILHKFDKFVWPKTEKYN